MLDIGYQAVVPVRYGSRIVFRWREVYDLFDGPGYDETFFNITEDMNIDEYEIDVSSTNIRPRYDVTSLLSAQLPAELPTVDKDLLILMAAYYGVIDRYAQLRRETLIEKEIYCCVHRIYHNTMFAVWWSK